MACQRTHSHAQDVLQEKARMARRMDERSRQRARDVTTKVLEKIQKRRTLLEESEEKKRNKQ